VWGIKKDHVVIALKFLFAGAILFWLWRSDRVDFSIFHRILNPTDLAVLFGLALLSLLLYAFRLYFILRSKGLVTGFQEAWRLSMMGLFFNYTLPGGTSGDLVKIYYLTKHRKDQRGLGVGLVLLDRVMGLFGMVCMAVFSFVLKPAVLFDQVDMQVLFFGTLVIFLALLVFFGFCLRHGQRPFFVRAPWLKKVLEVVAHLPSRSLLAGAFLLTVLSQMAAVMVLYYGAVAAGYQGLDPVSFFVVAPLGFMITAIPISPGGIGVGQVAFYALFKIYTGSVSDLGPSVATLYQVLLFLISLSGLYYYLRLGRAKATT